MAIAPRYGSMPDKRETLLIEKTMKTDGDYAESLSSEKFPLCQSDQWIVEHTSDGYVLHRIRRDIRKVYLEVTTRCNLRCANCVRNTWDEELADMSTETFNRVIDSLRDLPELREVYFGGFGEPLLHPKIEEMVRQVKSLGVRISMSTNGTLLTEEKTKALVDARIDRLFVSMDSTQAQLFSELRGGANFDLVVENVKRIRDIRERKGYRMPTIGLEFVVTDKNIKDIKNLPSLAREIGASIILLTHLLPHNEQAARQIAYGGNNIEIPRPEGWAIMAGDYVMWGTLSTPRSKWGAYRHCRFVNDKGIVIAWDGGVSPCYALMHSYPYFVFGERKRVKRYLLGNVNEKSLSDIWTGEEYVLFRSKVQNFRFPSCVDCGANCDLRQNNEDCWANSPSCADCLWAQDIVRCP